MDPQALSLTLTLSPENLTCGELVLGAWTSRLTACSKLDALGLRLCLGAHTHYKATPILDTLCKGLATHVVTAQQGMYHRSMAAQVLTEMSAARAWLGVR